MIDDRTSTLALLLPSAANDLEDDVLRLRSALNSLDSVIAAVQSLLASDNAALDTLQEVVDAVEAVQATLTVNDASFDTLQEVVTALKTLQSTVANDVLLSSAIGSSVQAYDGDLSAIAGLTSAADKVPYFTGSGAAALATLTGAARTLMAAVDAAAQRTALGLVIGTNVQAQALTLSALAGLTSAADKVAYFTGYGSAALATLTTQARTFLAATTTDAQVSALDLLAKTLTWSAVQTFSESPVFSKGWKETVGAVPTSLSIATGTVKHFTLAGAWSPTDGLTDGQTMVCVFDAAGYAVTMPTMTWVTNGGSAPSSYPSGKMVSVTFSKLGSTLYGWFAG